MTANLLFSTRNINLFLGSEDSVPLKIANPSQGMVVYRIRTTTPARYHVTGRFGIIGSSSSCTVGISVVSSVVLAERREGGGGGAEGGKKTLSSDPPPPSSTEKKGSSSSSPTEDPLCDNFLIEFAFIDEEAAKNVRDHKRHGEYLLERKKEGVLGRKLITSRIFLGDSADGRYDQKGEKAALGTKYHTGNRHRVKHANSSEGGSSRCDKKDISFSNASRRGGGSGGGKAVGHPSTTRGPAKIFSILGLVVLMLLVVQISVWLTN